MARRTVKKQKLAKAFSKLWIDNVKKLTEYYDDDDCKRRVEKRSPGDVQTEKMECLPDDDDHKISCHSGDTIIVEAEEDKLEERKGTAENSNSDIPALKRTHRIYGSLPSEWM